MKYAKSLPYVLTILTILGFYVYISKAWDYANSLPTIGDEGTYLYKGYMFARGDYRPFQDYGFWTNKAPLSFLVPGCIQLWFGPGLREGRYYAFVVSILTLIGIWITARRLGGQGWAVLSVWVFALSNAHILFLARAASQGLVACMMAWMFVLVLGEKRSVWQLVLGSALSALIVMTRQNMALVPFFLVLYIFWQYGKKIGWLSLGASAIIFIGFHIYYWPNILQLWSPWLPESLTPFLNAFRDTSKTGEGSSYVMGFSSVLSFVSGVQNHFFVLCTSVSALALFPARKAWKSEARFKMAVFLALLFFSLFFMHMWASLPTSYCVWCFSGYQVFYTSAGFLFALLVLHNGVQDTKPRQYALNLVLLFMAASLGLDYYREWGNWLLDTIQLPRIGGSGVSFVSIGDVFTYFFQMSPETQVRTVTIAGGVFLGILILFFAWGLHRFLFQKRNIMTFSLSTTLLTCVLVAGIAPQVQLTGSTNDGCSTNYLTYYEKAGETLEKEVPSGSLVYWRGSGRHLALMLYVNDVRIFPPQIHAGGGLGSSTNADYLLRNGRFNEQMDQQWREDADVLMVWDAYITRDGQDFVDQSAYKAVPFDMGGLAECEDSLLVFQKR